MSCFAAARVDGRLSAKEYEAIQDAPGAIEAFRKALEGAYGSPVSFYRTGTVLVFATRYGTIQTEPGRFSAAPYVPTFFDWKACLSDLAAQTIRAKLVAAVRQAAFVEVDVTDPQTNARVLTITT